MEAKRRTNHRLLRVALVLGAVATAAIVSAACAGDETHTEDKTSKVAPTIGPVANDPGIELPLDATPSPDGKDIYFIASAKVADEDSIGTLRQAAIFKVSAAGGPITKLFQGDPLVSPFGITISNDGATLFIADSGAATSEDRSDGRVYALSVGGGSPSPLSGTEGLAPGGVEVMGDSLYITGRRDGRAGLFKIGLGGGDATAVAIGDAFVDPSGVAIGRDGVAYVVDSGSAAHGEPLASVVKVAVDGRTETVISGLNVGHPAGIALSNDDKTLYVSGFDSGKGTDVVFTIDAATRELGEFTDTIADFQESAGLHRARNTDVFAWADSHANGTGTVYVLRGP